MRWSRSNTSSPPYTQQALGESELVLCSKWLVLLFLRPLTEVSKLLGKEISRLTTAVAGDCVLSGGHQKPWVDGGCFPITAVIFWHTLEVLRFLELLKKHPLGVTCLRSMVSITDTRRWTLCYFYVFFPRMRNYRDYCYYYLILLNELLGNTMWPREWFNKLKFMRISLICLRFKTPWVCRSYIFYKCTEG